ncbi:MAG: PIN domain-containing protein [Acidobacteria bacterium]|nr:PIN domain-containing protein [Acidobacteriota bacterium]
MAFVVVYDSCVLYSAPLRDLLMRMALADLYQAKWTRKIHEEWIRNLNKNRGIPVKILERVANLMDAHVRDALVEDYQKYEQLFVLPDPDDHHVLAAAIASGAKLIVTFNQKDFPTAVLSGFNIETQHPDEFIVSQAELNQGKFLEAVSTHRRSLKNPPKGPEEYLETLRKQGLPKTVSYLDPFRRII